MAFVSMSGLDLSFLKDKPKRGRPKKVETTPTAGWQAQMESMKREGAAIPSKRADFAAPVLMQDIKPFVSPIDGKEITSRSKLKAHERTHNVRQCGDFKRGELIAKEKRRVAETQRLADPGSIKWV